MLTRWTARTPGICCFAMAAAVLALAAPVTAAGKPSTRELVDKAVEAMGGKAIKKIESYMASSEIIAPMGTMTSDVYWAKPSHVLVKRTIPQMGQMDVGTDGTIGWSNNPMMGGYMLLEGKQMDEVAQQAMHIRLLYLHDTLDKDYDDVEVVGENEFDGARCWELGMKSKEDGKRGAIFFDADTGLIRGMRVASDAPGGPDETIVTIGDWKPIGNVNFFHTVQVDGGPMVMTVNYTKIEVNSVDPKMLAVPDGVKALVEKRANMPDDAELTIDDFSPQVQQMIRGMLDGLPENAEELGAMADQLKLQLPRMPGEYKQGVEYVLREINKRIAALGG